MPELIYLLVALILWPLFAYTVLKYGFGFKPGKDNPEAIELVVGAVAGFAMAMVFPVSLVLLLMAGFLRWTFRFKAKMEDADV